MALTNQPKRAFFVQTLGLVGSPIAHGVEKASQTYAAGAFIQDDDAGRITESASPIDGSAVTKRTFGMTLNAATGVTGADVAFIWVAHYTIFEITLSDATAGTHTLAQADQWRVFPVTKATANWYLDANAVSNTGGGIVIGFKDAIGVVDARVYCVFTNTARGGAHASSGVF